MKIADFYKYFYSNDNKKTENKEPVIAVNCPDVHNY